MSKQAKDLRGKTILFGVTGGIATYKAVDVVSRLRKRGAEVHVIMTQAAREFVTPLTFRTISSNPVYTDMFKEPQQWNPEHIALAERGDLLAVVPATANVFAKAANGIADDNLSTLISAFPGRKFFAPAMNHHMWCNPATRDNVKTLRQRDAFVMEPDEGRLASGAVGKGRLPSPQQVTEEISSAFYADDVIKGYTVTVTAGPTREYFDPVRFISNPSSGKMGYSMARAARERGAQVYLISGPTKLQPPRDVNFISVESAEQMMDACKDVWADTDILVKTAAVCDYQPTKTASTKIHKTDATRERLPDLQRAPDILKALGQCKGSRVLVGFAAETDESDAVDNARKKLRAKNLDAVVLNVVDEEIGFGSDDNSCFLITPGSCDQLDRMHKLSLARLIVDELVCKIRNCPEVRSSDNKKG